MHVYRILINLLRYFTFITQLPNCSHDITNHTNASVRVWVDKLCTYVRLCTHNMQELDYLRLAPITGSCLAQAGHFTSKKRIAMNLSPYIIASKVLGKKKNERKTKRNQVFITETLSEWNVMFTSILHTGTVKL